MLPVWPVSGRFGYWRISVEDIMIGAYGEGDRPVLSGNRTITLMEDRNVVRDIHMRHRPLWRIRDSRPRDRDRLHTL